MGKEAGFGRRRGEKSGGRAVHGGGARAHLEVHVGSLVQDLAEHRILLDEAPLAGAVLLHALAERLLLVGPLLPSPAGARCRLHPREIFLCV